MNVQQLMQQASESPTRVSELSGVSRMTIKRINDKSVTPSVATLREIALTFGLDVTIRVTPASDPDAAVAAREQLDPTVTTPSDRQGVKDWHERLKRHDFPTPRELVKWAGQLSAPQYREGARFFSHRHGLTQDRVTKILTSAAHNKAGFAVSGGASASMWTGDPQTAATILWVDQNDPHSANIVADRVSETLQEHDHFQPAGVIVAPAPAETFIDSFTDGITTFASPIQTVIDLYGINADLAALNLSKDW